MIKVTFETCLRTGESRISDFEVFQGNAATYLRCGGKPNMSFVGNLLLFAAERILQIDQELTKL